MKVSLRSNRTSHTNSAVDDAVKIGAGVGSQASQENDIGARQTAKLIAIDGTLNRTAKTVRFSDRRCRDLKGSPVDQCRTMGGRWSDLVAGRSGFLAVWGEIAQAKLQNVSLWGASGLVTRPGPVRLRHRQHHLPFRLGLRYGSVNCSAAGFDFDCSSSCARAAIGVDPLNIIWFRQSEEGRSSCCSCGLVDSYHCGHAPGFRAADFPRCTRPIRLGASRWQILRHVIFPTRCPEISPGSARRHWASVGAQCPRAWLPPIRARP